MTYWRHRSSYIFKWWRTCLGFVTGNSSLWGIWCGTKLRLQREVFRGNKCIYVLYITAKCVQKRKSWTFTSSFKNGKFCRCKYLKTVLGTFQVVQSIRIRKTKCNATYKLSLLLSFNVHPSWTQLVVLHELRELKSGLQKAIISWFESRPRTPDQPAPD